MLNYKLILFSLFLLLFAGCSSAISVDDGVIRTENGTSIIDAEYNAIQTKPTTDFYLEVAEQEYNKYSYLHKFGRNNDIDVDGGFETIWNGGGDYTGFPTQSETLEIRSNDIDDTFGGAGAWTVEISGLLNSTFHEQPTVTINLNGTSWVTIDSNLYYRASRIKVTSAGSPDATNEGEITLRHTTTTSNIFAVLPIGYGQTMISATTVPANKKAFLNSWYASIGNKIKGVSTIRLVMRDSGGVWQVKEEFSISGEGNSYVLRQYMVPKNNINAGTDIKIMADSSINNLAIAAGMDFMLESTN